MSEPFTIDAMDIAAFIEGGTPMNLTGEHRVFLRAAIARAIMSAKAGERELCALAAIAETKAPAQRNAKDQWIEQIGQRVADAIRAL